MTKTYGSIEEYKAGKEHRGNLKPIEFCRFFDAYDGHTGDALVKPNECETIIRITKEREDCFDIMLATFANSSQKERIYIGHWNDGVV